MFTDNKNGKSYNENYSKNSRRNWLGVQQDYHGVFVWSNNRYKLYNFNPRYNARNTIACQAGVL